MKQRQDKFLSMPLSVILILLGIFACGLGCSGFWTQVGMDLSYFRPGYAATWIWIALPGLIGFGIAIVIAAITRVPDTRRGIGYVAVALITGVAIALMFSPGTIHRVLLWEWQRHCPERPYNCFIVGVTFYERSQIKRGRHYLELGCDHGYLTCCERLDQISE